MSRHDQPSAILSVKIWLWSVNIFILLIVAVGGITRLTRSGLSITEWKPVSGIVPPLSQVHWKEEFQKYKATPEYQKVNKGMSLDDFKFIYFWEFIHRLIARLIGLVFFVPLVWLWIREKLSPEMKKHGLFVLFLGGLQGLMGWLMVKSGLVDNPHVSHYRLALHLGLAFFIFNYILWLIMSLGSHRYSISVSKGNIKARYRSRFLWLMALVSLQILYGAFVAGLKAGYMYNTYPLMEGQIIPAGMFSVSASFLLNLVENPITVQFIHRNLGIVVLVYALLLWRRLRRDNPSPVLMAPVNLVVFLIFLQVVLGILTLIYHVPVFLGVSHQVVALLILAGITRVLHWFK